MSDATDFPDDFPALERPDDGRVPDLGALQDAANRVSIAEKRTKASDYRRQAEAATDPRDKLRLHKLALMLDGAADRLEWHMARATRLAATLGEFGGGRD